MAGETSGEMNSNTNRRKYNNYTFTHDVFVGNLPENATEKSVSDLFCKFGEIKGVYLQPGKRNDGSQIAHVKFINEPDADVAVHERAGHMWDGVPLIVRKTERRHDGQPFSRDGRGNSSGSGDGPNTFGAGKRPFDNDGGFKASHGGNPSPQKEVILLTHVEDPCTFYAQLVSQADEIQELSTKLAAECPLAPFIDGKPAKGQKYGTIYSDDGMWYRCQLLQYITEEKALVKYIDWGNAEIVDNNKIVILPEHLANMPEMARRYRLNNLHPLRKDTGEAEVFAQGIKYLTEVMGNQALECLTTVNSKLDYLLASISLNGINIEDEILNRGFAQKHQRNSAAGYPKEGMSSSASSFQPQMAADKRSTGNNNQRFGKQPQPIRGSSNDMVPPSRSLLGSHSAPGHQSGGYNKPSPVSQWSGNHSGGESRVQGLVQDRDTAMREVMTLREQCKKYQQRIEQLGAQANKNNFNTKVNHIVEQLREIHLLRAQFPTSVNEQDIIEHAAMLLMDDPSRVLPQNLLHLPGVKQAMNTYQRCQQSISECKDKDKLASLTVPRDEARRAFHTSLVAFLKEMQSLPLQERFQKLGEVVNKLNKTFSNFLKVKANGSLPLNSLMEAFKDWKEKNFLKFCNARQDTDKCHYDYTAGINQLNEALSLKPTYVSSPPDLMPVLDRLSAALSNEYCTCNVEDSSGLGVVAMVIQRLRVELSQERDYVQQLKSLQEEYTTTEAEIRPWLNSCPDMGPLNEIRKKIKGLKSRLRHKLADQHDVEEENDGDNQSALSEIKQELSVIRNDLQKAFAEEDRTMAELAVLVKTHYPELGVLQPDLVTEVEHHGLVKQGRDIDQYNIEELPCTSTDRQLMKAMVCDNGVILKEFLFDGAASKASFIKRIEEYSSLKSEQLVPLSMVFFSKGERQAYVQMPFYSHNLLERLDSGVLSQEAQQLILMDIVKGVHCLHSNGIVHGALQPHNIFITDENRALVAPYNFGYSAAQRVDFCSEQCNNGLTFVAPELALSGGGEPSFSTDMYSIGALILLMQLPSTIFTMQPTRIPDIKAVMPFPLSDLVEQLITAPSIQRPSAEILLQSLLLRSPLSMATECYAQQMDNTLDNQVALLSGLGNNLENASIVNTWQTSAPLLEELEALRAPLEETSPAVAENGFDDIYAQYNVGENYASIENYGNFGESVMGGDQNAETLNEVNVNGDAQPYSATCHV